MIISQPAIGALLRKKRKRLGLTLPDAAIKAGVRKSVLYYAEQGRDVRVTTLQKILTAYRLKVSIT